MRKLSIVEVEWADAKSRGGWDERDEAVRDALPAECTSVGYLLRSDRDRIVVVQTLNHVTSNVLDYITIPRGCVKKVRRLE